MTATLALITFLSVIVIGFIKNGLNMYKLFVPSGMPLLMVIVMVPIEMISFFARPLTLAMRLFGNMLGGHVVMYIFGSFVVMPIGTLVYGWLITHAEPATVLTTSAVLYAAIALITLLVPAVWRMGRPAAAVPERAGVADS